MNFSDIRCRYPSKTRTKSIVPSQGLPTTRCFWSRCRFKYHKNLRVYRFNFWTLALENSSFSFNHSCVQTENKFDWCLNWLWASSHDTQKNIWRPRFGFEALAKSFKFALPRRTNSNQVNEGDHNCEAVFDRMLPSCLDIAHLNVEAALNCFENSSAKTRTGRFDFKHVELSAIHKA